MTKYYITIRATVTKTITVREKDEETAIQEAHSLFTVANDGIDENYTEETLDIEKEKP